MLRYLGLPIALALFGLNVVHYAAITGVPAAGPPGTNQAGAVTSAKRQLAHRPLDADGLFVLGIAADNDGEKARARALIGSALDRDPRNRAARLWLLDDSARRGALDQAVAHADTLIRLSPETAPAMTILLGRLALEQRGRAAIAARFANQSIILEVASKAAAQGLSEPALLGLMKGTDLRRIAGGVNMLQTLAAAPLLRANKPGAARDAWYRIAGYRQTAAVFDGTFKGLSGGYPFGWTLRNDANVETAIEQQTNAPEGGQLRMDAYGSLAVAGAEQQLALPSGPQILRFYASSPDPALGRDAFAWTIRCASGPVLVEAIVDVAAGAATEQAHRFAVPAGCPLQVLTLSKLGTPDQQERTVLVSRVAVTAS